MAEIINLGDVTFSERVVVSDPGYKRTTWCMKENVSVKPGAYDAYAVTKDR